MSSKGILHTSVGSDLTKTEWEQDGSHYFSTGTTFPAGAAESDLFYRADLKKLFQYNATSWVDLSNTVGTTDHGLMGGLTDDDHTQYLLGSGGRTLSGNWAVGGYDITGAKMFSGTTISAQQFRGGATFNASGETPFLVSSTFNVTNLSADMIDGYHIASLALSGHTHDHGVIGGLLDDDHTQYLLSSGGRTLGGNWAVGGWDITGIKAIGATTLTVQQIAAGATFNASGAAPFIVSSTFNVANLSVDFLDGQHSSAFALSGHTHDHGAIGGLGDDDHTIYLLADGSRALSGAISHGGFNITNVGALTGLTLNIGTTDTYLSRYGVGTVQTHNIIGITDSTYSLGTVGLEWKNIYVDNIYSSFVRQNLGFTGFDISNVGRLTGVTIYVGTTDVYLQRSGAGSLQTLNIVPVSNATYSIGTVGSAWSNAYINNLYVTSFQSTVSHQGYDVTNIGRVTGVTIYVGTTDVYLTRAGVASFSVQNIVSYADSSYSLGTVGNEWKGIYVDNVYVNSSTFTGYITGLKDYSANKWLDHSSITWTTSGAISGGGDLSASRTLSIAAGSIDHNSLLNYSAARHYDHSTISIVAGLGLTGGGDISASRTITWSGSTIDHGVFTGLTDDDHTIYLLATGARALSGALSFGGFDITNIGRATGVTIYVGTTDTYLSRIGAATLGVQHILPITDATYNVGGSANQFKNIYFSGTIYQGGTQFVGGSGVSDHGSLTGLTDDDHSQYLLTSGARTLTGAWTVGNWNVSHSGADVTNVGRFTGVTINVGTTDTYMLRSGATSIQTHNILPITDSTYALGTVGLEWKNLYVDNIYATSFISANAHSGYDITNVGRLTGVTIYVGTTDTYLTRAGTATMQVQNFVPDTDSSFALGTVGREWKNIYVDNIYTTAFASAVSHGGLDITNVGRATGVTIYVGTTDTYIQRTGTASIATHHHVPITDSTYNLGAAALEWKNVYADTIYVSGYTFTGFATGLKDYLDAKFLSHSSITWTTGTGLTGGGDLSTSRTLSLSHLGIQSLADPNVDKLTYWFDTGGSMSWLGIGTNLSITGGTLNATGGGVTDHGSLSGLTDDDHSQYLLTSGARTLTGAWTTGNWNVSHSGFDVTNIGRITGVTINVGSTDTYISRLGAGTIQTKNIVPESDYLYDLGSDNLRYDHVYANIWRYQSVLPVGTDAYGIIGTFQVGESVVWGNVVLMKSDAKFWKAQASSSTMVPASGIALGTYTANQYARILYYGWINTGATLTLGGMVYLSAGTAGAYTQTAPSTSGNQIQPLGVMYSTAVMYFRPDWTIVEV